MAANAMAFDFDMFDNTKNRMGTAAPKINRPAKPTIVREPARSKKQLKAEARAARLYAAKVLTVSAVLLVLLGTLIFGRVKIMEISSQAEKLQIQYNEAISENVRLESEVKSMYSIGNISAYAEDELGMIKKDCYQVNYFSVDSGSQAK